MSRIDFKVEGDPLKQGFPNTLNIRVVDRSIIDDEDLEHILGSLDSPNARIHSDVYKSCIGVDIFYDQEASLKGVVFVFGSQALAVRVPANVAKTSVAAYEAEKVAAAKLKSQGKAKAKEKPKEEVLNTRESSINHFRKLLQSNLAGFGMAQITLTLWYFLRERVGGVNLSTIKSEPLPPASFKAASKNDAKSNPEPDPQENKRGGKGKKGRRGGAPTPKKDSQKQAPDETAANAKNKNTMEPEVKRPEEEPANWDRVPVSPGEVIQSMPEFQHVSIIDVNTYFMSDDQAISLQDRVIEAAVRAWLSFTVADRLKNEVQNSPVVQPSWLSDKELTFFAESMVTKWKVLGERNPRQEVQRGDYKFGGDEVESHNYANKMRASKYQYLAHSQEGEERRYFLKRSAKKTGKHTRLTENELEAEPPSSNRQNPDDGGWEVSGGGRKGHRQKRRGQVRDVREDEFEYRETEPDPIATNDTNVDIPDNVELFTYGREEATSSDREHDMFLLRLLENRGSLRGPKYKDCGFIRRVWFPNLAQVRLGEERKQRKEQNSKKKSAKHDFVYDSWGDDTDEEEVARIQALTVAEGSEDEEDESEDENIGSKDPKRGVELSEDIRLNDSQLGVVGRVVAPNPNRRTRATLVHGPPGTGKTSTIAAAVIIFAELGEPAWIIAQSNVGIINVAEKLQDVGFNEFVLLVSYEYESYWKSRYKSFGDRYFMTKMLGKKSYQQRLLGSKAVLCTLASLSSPLLESAFAARPLQHLIIDEASQIDMTSEFMHLFYKHRSTLMSVCWFGDPNQLPPYGSSEGAEIQDIFKVEHLLANSRLLNISYRLPVPIAKFISSRMYQDDLKPFNKHPVQDPRKAVVFIDVASGTEEGAGAQGKSWKNTAEAEVVVSLVQQYYERSVKQEWDEKEKKIDYQIITPYEGQRKHVEEELANGNEADFIITTIAKTGSPGFLTSRNRMNVLLTRCKRGLVVVSQKDFVQRTDSLLRGLIYSLEPYDPWVSAEDVMAGYVNLPGSPAPNKRPAPPAAAQVPTPVSRTSLPPRPGARVSPLASQVVRQGLVQPTTATAAPAVKGAWGNALGVNRVKNPHAR